MTVNGFDPTGAEEVKVDLSKPLLIAGTGNPGEIRRIKIEFKALGVPLGSATTDVRQQPDGTYSVTVNATETSRFVVGGQVTTTVVVYGNEDRATGFRPSTRRSFPMAVSHSTWRTVPAAIAVVLTLFVVAYVRSSIFWLRRSERRTFETVNLLVGGALVGLTAIILSWLFGGPEPTAAELALCAFLGVVAGVATAIAAFRVVQVEPQGTTATRS